MYTSIYILLVKHIVTTRVSKLLQILLHQKQLKTSVLGQSELYKNIHNGFLYEI